MVSIRIAKQEDAEIVSSINIQSCKELYKGILSDDFLNSMDIVAFAEKLRKNYANGFLDYVVEDDNQIVGYFNLRPTSPKNHVEGYNTELYAIYMLPNQKRKGYGSICFEYIKQLLKTRGENQFVVWCLAKNTIANNFYQKLGGKLVQQKTEDQFGTQNLQLNAYGFHF